LKGVFIGTITTSIFQISSAVTVLVVGLVNAGIISFYDSLGIIFGANIGTTITAIIASIGTSKTAKKTTLAHFLFNFFGVLIFIPFLGYFTSICSLIPGGVGKQIAAAHTLFNVITTCIMFIFIKQFYNLINKFVPCEEEFVSVGLKYINKKLINNVIVGIELVKREVQREAELSLRMFEKSIKIILEKEINNEKYINNAEVVVDDLQKEITNFLTELTKKDLSDKRSKGNFFLFRDC
jgi:phosphate:Na+ symporter